MRTFALHRLQLQFVHKLHPRFIPNPKRYRDIMASVLGRQSVDAVRGTEWCKLSFPIPLLASLNCLAQQFSKKVQGLKRSAGVSVFNFCGGVSMLWLTGASISTSSYVAALTIGPLQDSDLYLYSHSPHPCVEQRATALVGFLLLHCCFPEPFYGVLNS